MATVLVVDDDMTWRTYMAGVVSDEHRVLTAEGGFEAITILKREPVDLVLLDMVMAEGDGFTVLARVMGMEMKPRVVVVSVLDQVDSAVKAMKLGACDYLVKPCRAGKVKQTVRKALSAESAPAA